MWAATGSQCKEIKRSVTWTLLGSLKTSRAAAFWIICRGFIVHDGSPARRALQWSSLEMTRAWTRSCAACSVRKAWSFLCCAMQTCKIEPLQCGLWRSAGHQRLHQDFWPKFDGVIVEEHSWMVKSCCRVGVAGKTRSSVFARLICRWCSFIHAEMSARQPEIRRVIPVGSSGWNER